jgi:CheY-like chemotaxis protein
MSLWTLQLGNCSYSVTVCDSGIRALEVLALPDHGIDLILADVMMPVR